MNLLVFAQASNPAHLYCEAAEHVAVFISISISLNFQQYQRETVAE